MDANNDLASYPNDFSSSDCLGWEGFSYIFWSVLQALGYSNPPQYERTIIRDHGVTRCRVCLVVHHHPPRPSSPTWGIEVHGYHLEVTCELAALNGISSFCTRNTELVEDQLLGLFPPIQADNAHWMRRYLSSPLRVEENPNAAAYLLMRDAMIVDLERQLADLELAHNNTTNELAQAEGGQNADADAPESDMDTEDDMPPLEAPPSPMGSQATVNNLDDL
nr:unnamed protein product [Digitaria exilis]